MVDETKVREILTSLLTEVAAKARADALAGQSDIASVWRRDAISLTSMDPTKVEEAIADINKATATKEGARRIINAIMVAAKAVAKIALTQPPV